MEVVSAAARPESRLDEEHSIISAAASASEGEGRTGRRRPGMVADRGGELLAPRCRCCPKGKLLITGARRVMQESAQAAMSTCVGERSRAERDLQKIAQIHINEGALQGRASAGITWRGAAFGVRGFPCERPRMTGEVRSGAKCSHRA